jgi:hypothetical protein
MVGKSVGKATSLGKAKQHFFKDLDLNAVITPSEDAPGAFTGQQQITFCQQSTGWHARLALGLDPSPLS